MAVFIFLILHWYLSLFGQTFYLHRYSAHKIFSMSPFWEKFWHLYTWLTQGTSYLNARAYAILHRMHHAYSDTEQDPHTPHFFKEAFTMMMHTRKIYNGVHTGTLQVEPKFDKNYPEYPIIDNIADHNISRLFFAAIYITFYIVFATHCWMFLFLPIHFLIGPIQGAIVNWAGHKYGYRNFPDEKDQSKNTLIIDFLMLGELFQNNHHHAGARPNFAAKWWEFDPVYPVIKLFNKLGMIKLIPLNY